MLHFHGRLLPLTINPDATLDLTRNLYPVHDFDPPFGTLLYEAAAVQFGEASERSPYSIGFSLNYNLDKRYQLVRNLKWDAGEGDGRGSDALKVYLRSLVRYIVWEARSAGVGKVTFLWSYPTSLPEPARIAMSDFWIALGLERFQTGMTVEASDQAISESEAACLAMKAAGIVNVSTSALTIGVDIGGGSTDISFWSKDELLNQVSFKIAGNDLLPTSMLTDEALAEILSICQPQAMQSGKVADAISKIRERPEVYIAGALSDAGGPGRAGEHPFTLHIAKNKAKSPWQQLRSMVYLYATGLSYFLGSQARVYEVPASDVAIYFGGRGSMFLKWLTIDTGQLKGLMRHAFETGLSRVVPDDGIQNLFRSSSALDLRFAGQALEANPRLPALKTEVAAGLLEAPLGASARAQGTKGQERSVKAGEIRWKLQRVPGEFSAIGWAQDLTEKDLNKIEAPEHFGSTLVEQFLSEMVKDDPNKYVTNQSLDPRLRDLRLKHNDIVQQIRNSANGSDKVLQPIFAYELKALMNQYAEIVANAEQ